jgi:hypothetical protein
VIQVEIREVAPGQFDITDARYRIPTTTEKNIQDQWEFRFQNAKKRIAKNKRKATRLWLDMAKMGS